MNKKYQKPIVEVIAFDVKAIATNEDPDDQIGVGGSMSSDWE